MEFQLLKTAASDVYRLPRVGAFSDLLDTEIAEMYTENEPHRPELAATARFLAEHFRIMDPDTKLFTSMSSTDPADLINKKLLKFTADDVEALMTELTDSSVEITKDVAKKLLGIVISEAIGIAYSLELRTSPEVLLSSKVRRSVDGPIIRTAADEDVSNEHTGRGRKQLHIPWRASEQKAPSARDIRDIYALLAYNSAFNAFVTTSVVGASNAKNDLLSQLALNFETTQYFDAILGNIKKSLANGSKIRLGDGTPLTPNPSIGAFFGADHKKFFATSKSDIPSSKPSSILQIISHGSSMDKHATFLPYASLSRKSLYGEQLVLAEDKGKEDASTAYTGIAARASVKALASKYSSNPAQMSEDLSAVLLRGFNTHLSMLRSNGIPFNKYKTLIPGLTDATTENLVRQALIDIVASLPKEFDSLSSAKAVCRQAIEKQHTKLAEKGLANKEVPAAVEKQYNGLIDFAAQIVLRLPINMAAVIESFDPREMLRPVPTMSKIPASQVSLAKEILGASDARFDDVFAVVVASAPSGGAAAYTYNQLMSSDNTKDFFILSAKQKIEKNEKRAGVIFAKLKYLMVQLQKNIISFSSSGPRRAFDEKSPAGRQSASLARLLLETINKSEDGEIQILEMLLSGCLQSIGVSKKINARALAGALAANTVDSPVIKQLVDEVAAQLPPKWNSADDSRVESDYNNINTYIDPWKGAPELYADPAHPFNKNKAALYMMHEGSFHTALHTMMSNGMVARYDQNRDEHVAYVEKTYSLPEIDDEVDVARVLDIDTKIAEMQSDKVLEKFLPLDAADVQKRRFAPREKPSDQEIARKRNVGLKFQDFFNRWSKSTIVAKLYTIPRTPTAQDPRTTYGADYFDALSVLIGRRFYELFDNYVDNKLELKNIGARAGQVLDEVHRQGAEALRDAAREQGEDTSGKGDGDEFSGRYTGFAREWALQPRFSKSTGGFDTQSLAGFVSECLVKKDIANRGGAEGEIARQFVDRLVMPLDAKRFKVSKDANPPILGLVMNRAVWAYGKITQTKNVTGLQRMLSDNIALNKTDLPKSPVQVLARVGAFVDPIVSAKSLAKGNPADTRAKAMNRAMVRTSSEFDNYEDWELDMIAYMRSYRAEVENEISNSAASADLKAMMRAIVADSAASTSGRWVLSEEQKQALTLFGQSLAQAGDIKHEVLWKQTFQYAMADAVKQVSAFLDSSGQKNADKVMAALVASRPIKLLWDENIKDLLGPGGLVEKTDEEKYALSIVALVSVLAEDSTLVTNLVVAPQALEERAAEVMKETKSAHSDAEDADFASDVDESGFGGEVDFKAHIDAMASKSSKMQTLIAAVFASAPPDFEEILSGSDHSIEEKLAATEKNISLSKLVSKESGQKYLRSAYSAQIGAFADGNAPANLQAQVDKAEDLRPKELLEKMPIVAPDLHKLVIADIERMLASIKIEVSSKATSLENVVAESEKARTQMQIQKETAHMADLQRMVFAGRELASSQAPELPVAARYKLAIQEFADYNGKRIEEWDRKLRSQQLRSLTSLDDKLRSQNSSLDKAGEDTIRATFGKDQELIALAMDPVVKQLFAVRTAVIAKVKMVNDLKAKLSQIDDTELNAFHDALREKEKEFTAQNASDMGYQQITEDTFEVSDEDELEFETDVEELPSVEDEDFVMIDEELSSVPDADGKMLSNKELDGRVAEKNKLKKSIVSVKAELARPTMRMEYGFLGRKTLEIFEKAIAADSFVSKNSREHMIEMNDILGNMTKYLLKGIGSSVVTEDEEAEILHTMQSFVDRFGKVLDRPIESSKIDTGVSAPATIQSPNLEPVGTEYDQELNAEIDATAAVIREALKTEKSPFKISNLKNLLLFVSAFQVNNRAFVPNANPKEVIALIKMIAKDVVQDRISNSTAENLTIKLEITQKRGLKLKTTPNFVDSTEEVVKSEPVVETVSDNSNVNESLAEAIDLTEKQSRVLAQLSKTFSVMSKGNPSVIKLAENVKSAGDWLSYVSETLSIVRDVKGFAGFSTNDIELIRRIDASADEIIDVLEAATESPEAAAALAGDSSEMEKITELISFVAKVGNHLSQVARQASAKNEKVIRTGDGWLLG